EASDGEDFDARRLFDSAIVDWPGLAAPAIVGVGYRTAEYDDAGKLLPTPDPAKVGVFVGRPAGDPATGTFRYARPGHAPQAADATGAAVLALDLDPAARNGEEVFLRFVLTEGPTAPDYDAPRRCRTVVVRAASGAAGFASTDTGVYACAPQDGGAVQL